MKSRGFTLIELLVVIAIIGLLATLSVVSFSTSREKSRISKGTSYSGQVLRALGDDMIARWDFNECTGSTVNDDSGNIHTATFQNGNAWSTDTPTGQGCSANLNGTNSYLSIAGTIPLANQSFTVTAWVKRTAMSNYQFFFVGGGSDGTNQRMILGFQTNSTFTCAFYSNDLSSVSTITDTRWHHYACSFDAVTKKRQIYIDGSLIASDTASGNFIGTNVLSLGQWNTLYFGGYIDDIRIYGRAVTSQEIHEMYAKSASRSIAKQTTSFNAELP